MFSLGRASAIEEGMSERGLHAGASGVDFFRGCADDASVELRPLADGGAVGVERHVAQDGMDECSEPPSCGTGLETGRYHFDHDWSPEEHR